MRDSAPAGVAQLVLLTGLLIIGGIAAGCGTCNTTCEIDESPPRVVTGRIVSATGSDFSIETGGEVVELRISGDQVQHLEVGSTYRFPLRDSDGEPAQLRSSLPSKCDCGGPYITHANGDAVDTSVLGRRIDLEQLAYATIATLVAAMAVWGTTRWIRQRRMSERR